MKTVVIDASVAVLAFFREPGYQSAQALFRSGTPLYAPDLIFAEYANVVWKRHRRGELSGEEGLQLLADFLRMPLEVTPCSHLAIPALRLALHTGRTVYDALYLALAVRTNSILVTADKRLANSLAKTSLAPHIATLDSTP